MRELTSAEETVALEAFTSGRVYRGLGEIEPPHEAMENMLRRCRAEVSRTETEQQSEAWAEEYDPNPQRPSGPNHTVALSFRNTLNMDLERLQRSAHTRWMVADRDKVDALVGRAVELAIDETEFDRDRAGNINAEAVRQRVLARLADT